MLVWINQRNCVCSVLYISILPLLINCLDYIDHSRKKHNFYLISPRHWSGKLVVHVTKLCEDKPGGSSQVPDSSCVRNEAVRRDKGQAAKVLRRTMGDLFVTNLMWAAASHRHTVTRSRDTQHIASHRDTEMLALQFTHLVGRYNTNRCTVTVLMLMTQS